MGSRRAVAIGRSAAEVPQPLSVLPKRQAHHRTLAAFPSRRLRDARACALGLARGLPSPRPTCYEAFYVRFAFRLASVSLPALAVAFAASAAALLVEAPAQAVEHQWHFGVDVGYAQRLSPDAPGFGGALYTKYGMNDWINLVAELSTSDHPALSQVVFGGRVGVEYVFDVLRWVPYVGALAGGSTVLTTTTSCAGAACLSPRLDLEVPFGLDYQVSRSFALGAVGKIDALVGVGSPVVIAGGFARAEYFFGF